MRKITLLLLAFIALFLGIVGTNTLTGTGGAPFWSGVIPPLTAQSLTVTNVKTEPWTSFISTICFFMGSVTAYLLYIRRSRFLIDCLKSWHLSFLNKGIRYNISDKFEFKGFIKWIELFTNGLLRIGALQFSNSGALVGELERTRLKLRNVKNWLMSCYASATLSGSLLFVFWLLNTVKD